MLWDKYDRWYLWPEFWGLILFVVFLILMVIYIARALA